MYNIFSILIVPFEYNVDPDQLVADDGTLSNSVNSDEMQQDAASHQGRHCLLSENTYSSSNFNLKCVAKHQQTYRYFGLAEQNKPTPLPKLLHLV